MCYPKPGPRCSYHAKKTLRGIKQKIKNHEYSNHEEYGKLKEKLEAAELDYDSTPAGMAILELRIERGEDRSGTYQARLDYCKANRKVMLTAIKAQDIGDSGKHKAVKTTPMGENDFLEDSQMRQAWSNREDSSQLDTAYSVNGENLAKDLTSEETNALHWYTSDGFSAINSQLHKDNGTFVEGEFVREYKEQKIRKAIKTIDGVFERRRREEPIVVYRGLNYHNFPQELQAGNGKSYEEEIAGYAQYAKDTYKPGSEHIIPNYLSTSMDPMKTMTFSGSNVVMEIKAKSTIPVGFLSSWGDSEKEMLIQRDRKFKVAKVTENVEYENPRYENFKFTVIQLEEID